jgi:O-antigen/teichoic acid export membrane protein
VRQFAGFGVGIILARILGPYDFGLVSVSMVVVSIFSYFISSGLFSSIIQREKVDDKHLSSVFYFNIVIAVALTIIVLLAAPYIAVYFNAPEIFVSVLQVLSTVFIFSALTQVQEAIIRKEMNFKILAQGSVLSTLISGSVGVGMAWQEFGVWSLVVQVILEKVVFLIYVWIKSTWMPGLVFSFAKIKELWTFGFHMFLSALLNNIVSNLDSIVISKRFSTIELGLFSRAKTLNSFAARYSSESISAIMFPAMSRQQNNKEKLNELGTKSEIMIAFISFGLLGWLYLTSEIIIFMVLGPKWLDAIPIYKLLCLSGFAYPMGVATSSILQASGLSKIFLKLEFFRKIISILGLFIGLSFGIKGYLISLVITGVINLLINIYVCAQCTGQRFIEQLRGILPYPAIAVVSVYCVMYLGIQTGYLIFDLIIRSIFFALFFIGINRIIKTKALQLVFIIGSNYWKVLNKYKFD